MKKILCLLIACMTVFGSSVEISEKQKWKCIKAIEKKIFEEGFWFGQDIKSWKYALDKRRAELAREGSLEGTCLVINRILEDLKVSHLGVRITYNVSGYVKLSSRFKPRITYHPGLAVKVCGFGLKVIDVSPDSFASEWDINQGDTIISVLDHSRRSVAVIPTCEKDICGLDGDKLSISVMDKKGKVKQIKWQFPKNTVEENKKESSNKGLEVEKSEQKNTEDVQFRWLDEKEKYGYLVISKFISKEAALNAHGCKKGRVNYYYPSSAFWDYGWVEYQHYTDQFRNASQCKKLIIDLRDNSGGSIIRVMEFVTWLFKDLDPTFLFPDKEQLKDCFGNAPIPTQHSKRLAGIFYRWTKSTKRKWNISSSPIDLLAKEFYTIRKKYKRVTFDFSKVKMICLVDGFSASAAELMAGLLKENGVPLLGRKTSGNCLGILSAEKVLSITQIVDTNSFDISEYNVELTYPKYEAFDLKSRVENNGIKPNYVMRSRPRNSVELKKDPWIQRALEVLDKKK